MDGLKLPLPELATTPLAERVELHEIVNRFKVPRRLLNGSRGLADTPDPGTTTSVPVPLALADVLKVAVWTSSAALANEVRHAKVKRWMSFTDIESFMDLELSGELGVFYLMSTRRRRKRLAAWSICWEFISRKLDCSGDRAGRKRLRFRSILKYLCR
jgi:hypothetical protein